MVKKWGWIRILLSFFNPNFNDKFNYICSSFLIKTAQLIIFSNLFTVRLITAIQPQSTAILIFPFVTHLQVFNHFKYHLILLNLLNAGFDILETWYN